MKVLFSDTTYSYIMPGGKQVHANKLYHNLKDLGVEVEYENWYDPNLSGNVIHFFGYNDYRKILELKKQGYKLVYTHIVDGLTNLPRFMLYYHYFKNLFLRLLPNIFNSLFPWRILNLFDAIVYMHKNDRDTAIWLYKIDPKKTFIIPHGVDELNVPKVNLNNSNASKYLISIGSIVERKNSIFLAEICKENKIPIKFIGHPFESSSEYFRKFKNILKTADIEYLGFVKEEIKCDILKDASGFVLLSFGESGCISVYEAAANGLPLLLSDLPWAKAYDSPNNIFFCSPTNKKLAGLKLMEFYKNATRKNYPTIKVLTWNNIAKLYLEVYKTIYHVI